MGTFLSTFLSDSAELPELTSRVRSTGPVPLSSPLPVADLAADSVAATKLMASLLCLVRAGARDPKADEVPQVRIVPQLVAGAYRSDQLFRWNGNRAPAWAPLSGFFASSDGWVRTHANYPHHEAALRSVLRLDGSATTKAVAHAISHRNTLALEDEAAASGAIISAVRSPSSWRGHPQAQTLEAEGGFSRSCEKWSRACSRDGGKYRPAVVPLAGIWARRSQRQVPRRSTLTIGAE